MVIVIYSRNGPWLMHVHHDHDWSVQHSHTFVISIAMNMSTSYILCIFICLLELTIYITTFVVETMHVSTVHVSTILIRNELCGMGLWHPISMLKTRAFTRQSWHILIHKPEKLLTAQIHHWEFSDEFSNWQVLLFYTMVKIWIQKFK